MKILNKKNILLIILSFVFALSTLVFASTATVRADDAVETPTGVFEVVEGASIRIGDKTKGEKGSGIRFMVRMSADVVAKIKTDDAENKVKLGVIITTKEIFDARNAQYDQETGEEIPDYINSIGLYVNKTDDGNSNNDGIVINEDTIYDGTGADAGYFMANAAVTQIKEGNEKANYTAIAYIYNSESADKPYEYALIEDFSRSIVETASKVYINGEEDDETTSLESLRCVQGLENFGADASNPVLINDDNDLYALSDAVNVKEKAFTYEEIIEEETTQTKPVQFKLNKDVTVDWDFEQIGAGFGGEFVASESKVEIVNNKNLVNAFANATKAKFNNECVNNTKLFNATERGMSYFNIKGSAADGEKEYWYYDNSPETCYVQVTEDTDGNGKDDAAHLEESLISGVNNIKNSVVVGKFDHLDKITLKLNWSKQELLDMLPVLDEESGKYVNSNSPYGTYNQVRFKYLVTRVTETGSTPVENDSDVVGLFDVLAQKKFFGYEKRSNTALTVETYMWRPLLLSIEDFTSAMGTGVNDEYTLQIGNFASWSSYGAMGTFLFYVTDVELVYDTATIFSAETQASKAGLVHFSTTQKTSPVYSEEDGSVTTKGTYTIKTHEDYSSYIPSDSVATTGITNDIGYTGDTIRIQLRTHINTFVKLRYTQQELRELASAYGYNAIKVTYMIEGSGEYITEGVIADNYKSKTWHSITLSLDKFCSYFGALSLKPGKTIDFQNMSEYEVDSSSSVQSIPEELVQLRCARTYATVHFNLANISFTTITEQA